MGKETGIKDFNGNMIYENHILLNLLFGDLWLVSRHNETNEWIITKINDGYCDDLEGLIGFKVVGEIKSLEITEEEVKKINKELKVK